MTSTSVIRSLTHLAETDNSCSEAGTLIVNADDWGRDSVTTDRIADCVSGGAVSSASAMVFMQDSERAAEIARQKPVDVGLHLNFTSQFTGQKVPMAAHEHQQRVRDFLLRGRLSQAIYHPLLANSFKFLVSVQVEEFSRLYGEGPSRLDGHHHMHLCANVVFGNLIPTGTITRRNFSFLRKEKSGVNRLYRSVIDRVLAKRHRLTDFFFSLPPLEPADRLKRIFALAKNHTVEVETHPVNPEEYRFLMEDGIQLLSKGCVVSRGFRLEPTRAIGQW